MTVKLCNNEKDIKTAALIIQEGGLVALPTETVYGLGANALDSGAVAGIFSAKGRPQDNPLIVHIETIKAGELLTTGFTENAKKLAAAFWPGPLTIIQKKSDLVPSIVSAGLDTVGIRMPSHPVMLAVIKEAGVPIAAPSANTSGRPSPTCAHHVWQDMQGKIAAVLDGGSCEIGVESTVVDATGDKVEILRPGAVTAEDICRVLGEGSVATTKNRAGEKPLAPGMKYRHYAPAAPVILVQGSPDSSFNYIKEQAAEDDGVLCFSEYVGKINATIIDFGLSYDKRQQSNRLFYGFRELDARGVARIFVQCPREYGRGVAIVNRLKKAAEGNVVNTATTNVVGVVGRSGSGKSYVSTELAQGGVLVDADGLYNEMLKTNKELLAAILAEFPEAFVGGALSKPTLREIVFGNKPRLERLNAITHPKIVAEIVKIIKANHGKNIYIDAPTLFESGLHLHCTYIVGVVARDSTCIERIVMRDGISKEQGEARLANQKKTEFFLEYCDKIIENE